MADQFDTPSPTGLRAMRTFPALEFHHSDSNQCLLRHLYPLVGDLGGPLADAHLDESSGVESIFRTGVDGIEQFTRYLSKTPCNGKTIKRRARPTNAEGPKFTISKPTHTITVIGALHSICTNGTVISKRLASTDNNVVTFPALCSVRLAWLRSNVFR